MLAAELARVGVTARIRTLEWAAFVEKVDAGDFEAASLAWSAVDPNPDPYFYWHSSQCSPQGLNNGCYANPEADRLMETARLETDPARRKDDLRRACTGSCATTRRRSSSSTPRRSSPSASGSGV